MTRDSEKHFSVLVIFLLLCLFLVLPVSASSASTTAQQINSLLDKKIPYTIEITPAQMTAAGFDTFSLSHNTSTYKIYVKKAAYNTSMEAEDIWIQAWRDGQELSVRNPVHMYMPWEGGIHGANANAQLQNYIFILVSWLDQHPLGHATNDDTYLIYAASDGSMTRNTDGSWSSLRDGAGEASAVNSTASSYNAPYLQSTATTDVYTRYIKSEAIYNTSIIVDSETIDSAIWSVYTVTKTNALGSATFAITGVSPLSSTTVSTSDYQNFTGTRYASDTAYAAWTGAARINISFNAAGLSAISKTGITPIQFRFGCDVDNNCAWTWGSAQDTSFAWRPTNHATASQRPYLEVITSPGGGDTTPPASITGLANGTFSCPAQSVDLSWTNPADPDYYRLNAYINGTLTYYSNATTSVTLSGLPESSTITFDTRTEDLAGNLDTDWVNTSILTGSCATPTPTTPPPTTATPTPTPMTGCTFVNTTAESIRANSTSWSIVLGNISWGVTIENVTQGNLSHWSCIGTPYPTTTPAPTGIPNLPAPGTDAILDWVFNFWWLWLLIIAFLVLVRW